MLEGCLAQARMSLIVMLPKMREATAMRGRRAKIPSTPIISGNAEHGRRDQAGIDSRLMQRR
jgi:hypothetical protein